MTLFEETVKWKILSFFFANSDKEFYVNELSRSTGVSSGSVSITCGSLLKEGLLKRIERGNLLFYKLNGDNPLVRKLKTTWFLERLLRLRKSWENEEFQSVALYGSYASGEFVSKSDVDLLVITNVKEEVVFDAFRKIMEKNNREVSITVMPVSKWMKIAKERDRFYTEVISNHILLYGTSLVVG
ncbi:MAG: nucleotidyltransferase domain-containing protein [Candidatus Micrarchaeota archaeon]